MKSYGFERKIVPQEGGENIQVSARAIDRGGRGGVVDSEKGQRGEEVGLPLVWAEVSVTEKREVNEWSWSGVAYARLLTWNVEWCLRPCVWYVGG